ncbi:MAG: hypothetical protein HY554_19600, partial [Elusimicrobia bacterium]|nr:hypothetical protein [Elusimicrobiota bacterium]
MPAFPGGWLRPSIRDWRAACLSLAALCAPLATPRAAPPAPRLSLPLDDGAGALARDVSGSGWQGTLRGDAAWVRGMAGAGPWALGLDGTEADVEVPEFGWPAGGPVTVSFWTRVNSGYNYSGAFDAGGDRQGQDRGLNRFQAHVPWPGEGNQPTLYWDYGDIGSHGRLSAPYQGYLDRWVLVTLVSEGRGGRFKGIYLDGELKAQDTGPSDGPAVPLSGLRIGSVPGGFHKGRIADFRIYDRALEAQEVQRLYADTRPRGALEVWVSPVGTGRPEKGTHEQPYVADTPARFDSLMRAFGDPAVANPLFLDDGQSPVVIHLLAGTFLTRGQNSFLFDNWQLKSRWTLEGAGRGETTIELEAAAHAQPAGRASLLLLEGEARGGVPEGETVRDLGLVGNFSRIVGGFEGRRLGLTVEGVRLAGQHVAVENVRLTDFGSTEQEAFPVMIVGQHEDWGPAPPADGGPYYDRGCSGSTCTHITGCLFDGRIHPSANRQLMTLFSIQGAYNTVGQGSLTGTGRVDVFRQSPYIADNTVLIDEAGQAKAGGEGNMAQAFSLFNAVDGRVQGNRTTNAAKGYYSDSLHQKALTISGNEFLRTISGVHIRPDDGHNFGNEDVRIIGNTITVMPVFDGGRGAIGLFRGGWAEDRFEHFSTRFLRDVEIRGNVIALAEPPAGPILNSGILATGVDGLAIEGNRFDARLASGYSRPIVLDSVRGRAAGGAPQGPYPNTRVTVADNVDDLGRPVPAPILTSPMEQEVVQGEAMLSVLERPGLSRVELSITGSDGQTEQATLTRSPFILPWRTSSRPDGPHRVTVTARSASGVETASLTVNVHNQTPTLLAFSPQIVAAVAGQPFQVSHRFQGGPLPPTWYLFTHLERIGDPACGPPGSVASPLCSPAGDAFPIPRPLAWSDAVSYPHALTLPAGTPPGEYRVMSGLGSYLGGPSWTLTPGPGVEGDGWGRYQVGTVRVGRDVPPPVDTTAPTIAGPAALNVGHDSADVRWTTDEPADGLVEYGETAALGRSTPAEAAKVLSHAVALDGLAASKTYHYRVVSKDAAGNAAASEIRTFATAAPPDAIPPTVALTAPAGGALLRGAVAVAASAADDRGVAGVQFLLDDQALGAEDTAPPYAADWNTALLADGQRTLKAVARDAAGNRTTSAPVEVAVDNAAPTIAEAAALGLGHDSASIQWTTDEAADSLVEYGETPALGQASALDGNRVTSHGVGLRGLKSSTLYRYRVSSRDAAGNAAASELLSFTTSAPPDTAAPAVALTAPADGALVRGTVAVGASATDDEGVVGVQLWLDGRELGGEDREPPYGRGWDTTRSPDGRRTLKAVARDAAGHQTISALVTVTVDNAAPTIAGPAALNVGHDSADVRWTTDEPADGLVEYGETAAL